ncbi:uncharacterized protein DUF563 [Pontibacter ummariensis]|uniref:Glycosyltransferase 61 catalytic domain-containing protein n=1 Tax=Pontibacter ummariensis TaxID=1610492 RepID=A0A239C625_9BACT|nr:glycosyltransferase family 61 protein [Pontibacter ummariensis]PRY15438.1 uncharacterized protein DUF563 [Pontibacter ummariensis]SNS15342.1 Protein of unknown function [Pontibacter ummariensis]
MKKSLNQLIGNSRNQCKSVLLRASESLWRKPLTKPETFKLLEKGLAYESPASSVYMPAYSSFNKLVHAEELRGFDPDRIWLAGSNTGHNVQVCRSGNVLINEKVLPDLDFGCTAGLLDFPIKRNKVRYPLVVAPWAHFWGGYYDYVMFVVAKLCRVEATYGKDIWKEAKVCYPLLQTCYEKDFMTMLGISEQALVDTKRLWNTALYAERVIVGANQPSWSPSLGDIRLLRERFCQGRQFAQPKEKLYLTRRGRRKVKNEEEVRNLMLRYGFRIVEDQPRSVPEQISLFQNASVVAGPHGAAFTNLLWCDPGTKVLEFFSSGYKPNYFYYLSTALDLQYSCITEESLNQGNSHWGNVGEDLSVDLKKLQYKLEQLLSVRTMA